MTSRLFTSCILVFFLFAPALSFPAYPPNDGDSTVVVVVGTVHNPSGYYDIQTLCQILDRVRPDLILVELDSSFFTTSMSLKREYVGVSMENRAVSLYLQSHTVPIRPYDIEGRNRIYEQHNYFSLQRELSSALNSAERDSLLGAKPTLLLNTIIRFDKIGAGFGSERPEVINSTACDVAMESKQYYAGEGMLQIVESVPSLVRFTEFARFRRDFWITRNDKMVDHILTWMKVFPARKILVLCGYEHRYYLRNALIERAKSGWFSVSDYWTY